jgi:hypothetical protein
MGHFAQINSDKIVQQVIVVNNEVLHDDKGVEQESIGVAFCQSLFGSDTNWVQTSYNGNFRGCFAGAGMSYDPIKDEFIAPEAPTDSTVTQ